MIGGIIMILVVLWVYQSAMRAKVEKVLFWVAVSAILFLLVQFSIYWLLNASAADGKELASIGDRKIDTDSGFLSTLKGILFELLAPTLGVLAVAFVRTKFILKEELNIQNLFSGIKELFIGIKDSFKTSAE